jgi:hypothetical protein
MLSKIDWSDYVVEGKGQERLSAGATSKLGRVVEETQVSYKTMQWTAIGAAALGVGAAVAGAARSGKLKFR